MKKFNPKNYDLNNTRDMELAEDYFFGKSKKRKKKKH